MVGGSTLESIKLGISEETIGLRGVQRKDKGSETLSKRLGKKCT